jgi:hypothetical protein
MSDEQKNLQAADSGFEHEDLSPRGVFYFMGGLVALVVILYGIIFGMYRALDSYDLTHQPAMSPMVAPQADTRNMTTENTKAFPQPRLEKDEGVEFRDELESEDRELATYNWVDKDKGIVQIPIERAKDLIVQRGLPVRPENGHAESANPEGKTAMQSTAPVQKKKKSPNAKAGKASVKGK